MSNFGKSINTEEEADRKKGRVLFTHTPESIAADIDQWIAENGEPELLPPPSFAPSGRLPVGIE
jgi:hypothetical protein